MYVGNQILSYAACSSEDLDLLVIKLPLVFYNDGATPIIINNLKLIQLSENNKDPIEFVATSKNIENDEERKFATNFYIPGRQVKRLICEFQRRPRHLNFEEKKCVFELYGNLNNNEWGKLTNIIINVQKKSLQPLIVI